MLWRDSHIAWCFVWFHFLFLDSWSILPKTVFAPGHGILDNLFYIDCLICVTTTFISLLLPIETDKLMQGLGIPCLTMHMIVMRKRTKTLWCMFLHKGPVEFQIFVQFALFDWMLSPFEAPPATFHLTIHTI